MNETYQLGLILAVFGGFLALNSTGLFARAGLSVLFLGTLVGVLGVLQSSLSGSS